MDFRKLQLKAENHFDITLSKHIIEPSLQAG